MLAGCISDAWRSFILAAAKILHVFYGIHHQYPAFDVSGQAQLTLSHLRYGQHLTKGQVDALSVPHPHSTGLVENWLSHHDLLHDPESQLTRSFSRGWISLCVPVGRLEQMLGTKYHVYKHFATETTIIRTIGYSLPSILHDHVTVVTPSTYFGHPKPHHKTSFVQRIQDFPPEVLAGLRTLPQTAVILTITPQSARRVMIRSPPRASTRCIIWLFLPRTVHWVSRDTWTSMLTTLTFR